ncbi:M-phase phosphoprotein 8-like [Mizuhopecten yessoensis]|uniref:Replicase polyprotein 1a n=1 Tax=Mizuhopecten yessoensis TaxID=6573 RepID=A0A210PWE6_MIZYE|nr:M-phase phosphoprotein 8-like [Mizuhopecten yessoensis]OWF40803.1 Replicase polyprotein 1a [Mizuhopecten yessoensis]
MSRTQPQEYCPVRVLQTHIVGTEVTRWDFMGAIVCSIACLLIQRTVLKALLWEPTDFHHDMPVKRGRPKKKHDEVDKNVSGEEEGDGLLSRRASNRRQKKTISYNEESPNVTKKAKLTRNSVFKDANDNEITEAYSKIPKKEKISKRTAKTELTEKKVLKIKTEEKGVTVKTKGLLRKKKKKENKISDEKQISGDEGDRNTTADDLIDNSPQEKGNEIQGTPPGRTEVMSCSPRRGSTPDVTVNLEATFTVQSPSAQEDACLSGRDTPPTNVSREDLRENNVTRKETNDISLTSKDTRDTVVTDQDTQDTVVTDQDTQDTVVTDKDTRDTVVTDQDTWDTSSTRKDTQDTVVTDQNTRGTVVTDQDTQDTSSIRKDTHDTGVKLTDTWDKSVAPKDTSVTQEGTENRRDTQKDKHYTHITRLENADTLAEKVALKLASQQNDCLRPLLEKMDDLMKAMADLSQENKELRHTCGHAQADCIRGSSEDNAAGYKETTHPSAECSDSAVQTLPTPQVHAQTQTIENYQRDTSRDELTNVQNERDILWAKCQSQTKVIRDLQNDLYTTRNDFSKDKVTYQATLVSVLATLSDYTRLYSDVVARLSRDNLSLDELCKLMSEASTRHSRDDCNTTDARRMSDDLTLTGPRRDSNSTSEQPAELAEIKLEPRSPPGN